MLYGYVPVAVMVALATIIAAGMVAGSYLLGPKKPTRFKQESYECGMTPVGTARERFPIKFYLIAMLFIIFDIETIFLYPWVVTFHDSTRSIKLFSLVEMGVFVLILFVGYIYIWRRGAFEWDEESEHVHEPADPKQLEKRGPIRFGNEASGPIRLPNDAAARKSA
jgi:NADH-quinone oxidoreductase subunit A